MYDELKDEKEIAIIKKHGYNAKCYTAIFTGKAKFFYAIIFLILVHR